MCMWLWRWGLLLLLGLGLAACSGSGSSGFDGPNNDSLHPERVAENALIAEVIQEAACTQVDMRRLCPTDTNLTPTGEQVTTPASNTPQPIVCPQGNANTPCRFALTFTLQGLSPASLFRVAARPVASNVPWRIGDAPELTGAPARPRLHADIEVLAPPETAEADFDIQLAVLVIADSTAMVPSQFDLLEESGADLAFVTTLTVQR
jgi:hypothetical protein